VQKEAQKLVLMVDDSRVTRMSLKKALMSHDAASMDIAEVASAEEAIEYLKREQRHPDIIFMDVMMAGMDGLTATIKIKATPNLSHIPVVICTGNQSELDNDNAISAGAMAVLTKPPGHDAVDDIMSALAAKAAKAAETIETIETTPRPKAPPQSVVVKVDKATMTAKVVEIIEQKLLPKMTQQAQDIATDVGHKISTEIIEQQLAGKVQAEIDRLFPTLQSQLLAAVQQESAATIGRAVEQQVHQAIAINAQQAVEALVANVDVSTQASDALAIQAQTWLAKQERQLQIELGMQIGPRVMAAVDKHLEDSLAAMIAPLVSLQVDKNIATQVSGDSEQKLVELTKRVSQLNTIVMGLAISVVVLAVFTLL
jgi:CheY-like chemotaxis protein